MRFRYEERIAHPIDACFAGLRDHQPDLVPYLDGIEEIRVRERVEVGPGRLRLVNEWVSDYRPSGVVAKVLRPEWLRWLDTVTWDEPTRTWEWRLESIALSGLFLATGKNRMEPDGERATRFVIEGDLEVYVEKLPGIPSFVGRAVRPQVERFIVGMVEPRQREICAGLAKWLDARRSI